ncbi:MAG: YgaP family membrane protein [Candidatus Bipolaricaulota bacterium]
MKTNVGDLDSRIRIRVGLILILVGIVGLVDLNLIDMSLTLGVIFLVIGLISFVTGSTRTCGIYSVFGIDTSGREESKGD